MGVSRPLTTSIFAAGSVVTVGGEYTSCSLSSCGSSRSSLFSEGDVAAAKAAEPAEGCVAEGEKEALAGDCRDMGPECWVSRIEAIAKRTVVGLRLGTILEPELLFCYGNGKLSPTAFVSACAFSRHLRFWSVSVVGEKELAGEVHIKSHFAHSGTKPILGPGLRELFPE